MIAAGSVVNALVVVVVGNESLQTKCLEKSTNYTFILTSILGIQKYTLAVVMSPEPWYSLICTRSPLLLEHTVPPYATPAAPVESLIANRA